MEVRFKFMRYHFYNSPSYVMNVHIKDRHAVHNKARFPLARLAGFSAPKAFLPKILILFLNVQLQRRQCEIDFTNFRHHGEHHAKDVGGENTAILWSESGKTRPEGHITCSPLQGGVVGFEYVFSESF